MNDHNQLNHLFDLLVEHVGLPNGYEWDRHNFVHGMATRLSAYMIKAQGSIPMVLINGHGVSRRELRVSSSRGCARTSAEAQIILKANLAISQAYKDGHLQLS